MRLAALLVSALLLNGCFIFSATVAVLSAEDAPVFTADDQVRAKAIVTRIATTAGFSETQVAATLAAREPSDVYPYRTFVSFGGGPEDKGVSILGMMKTNHREIHIFVRDYTRGDPKPATRQLIDSLRSALESEFPGHRVDVTPRKSLYWFAP